MISERSIGLTTVADQVTLERLLNSYAYAVERYIPLLAGSESWKHPVRSTFMKDSLWSGDHVAADASVETV